MATNDHPMKLAVLIDADNTSARVAGPLFEEIAKIGAASVRRIYGDFSNERSKGWAALLTEHAIVPHQQFANTVGKNASDITLVIDAMDLLHEGRVDGFCLVSSDSDFTRLAQRIREQGLAVYGFGEQKTPKSLQQSCDRFFFTENLGEETANDGSPAAVTKPLAKVSAVVPAIARAFAQSETDDGWANLGTVGTQIIKLDPAFDPRTYGFRKLIDLVRATNRFEVEHKQGQVPKIRAKASKTAKP